MKKKSDQADEIKVRLNECVRKSVQNKRIREINKVFIIFVTRVILLRPATLDIIPYALCRFAC